MAKQILSDFATAYAGWKIAILRYFNPAGAYPSRFLSENPQSTPGNLIPTIAQVAIGKLCLLPIFREDYPTTMAQGRDYLHVMDLAYAHLAALVMLFLRGESFTINLGTKQLDLVTQPARPVARRALLTLTGIRCMWCVRKHWKSEFLTRIIISLCNQTR